ncbi:hypothetical protein PROFUN_01445 [Planoprotostelium fungivorum]|uniref:Uncharacterized protein n=1 Tax=Planoprotostelium fungivorum TaxID=1890364 RepID=A0A2P6NT89_9EUKA|nr:hypothetical protein PROFUN_01445 [Planoprotostelium fungivorum]
MRSIGFLFLTLVATYLADDFLLGPTNWTTIIEKDSSSGRRSLSDFRYIVLPGNYSDADITISNTYISNFSLIATGDVRFSNVNLTVAVNRSVIFERITFKDSKLTSTADLLTVSHCLSVGSTWSDTSTTETITSCDFADSILQMSPISSLSVSASHFTRETSQQDSVGYLCASGVLDMEGDGVEIALIHTARPVQLLGDTTNSVIVDEKKRYTAKEITEGLSLHTESSRDVKYVSKDKVDMIRMSKNNGKALIYED